MTILEQILAGLQQKFIGVDAAFLTRIATKKAEGITDGTKVNSIVEGIGFPDVLTAYGDFRAGAAARTAIRNYERKHKLKDGKPISPYAQVSGSDAADDVATIIANAVHAAVKPLSDRLSLLEKSKLNIQAIRQEWIAKEYGLSENYIKKCIVKDYYAWLCKQCGWKDE